MGAGRPPRGELQGLLRWPEWGPQRGVCELIFRFRLHVYSLLKSLATLGIVTLKHMTCEH